MAYILQERGLKRSVQEALGSADNPEARNSSTSSEFDEKHDPYSHVPGVERTQADNGEMYYLVDWASSDDPLNPRNWSMTKKVTTTVLLILVAFVILAGSSIDSVVLDVASKDYHVAPVVEALGGTGIFLVGLGVGALVASPSSELIGRYYVYVGTLVLFAIWEMASALAPNIGAQIAFRFLAGICGAAPLTVSGGTISDVWNAKEKTFAFPLFATIGFGGPILGPVIGAYIPVTGVLSWHWTDWIILIGTGLVLAIVFGFMQETLAPRLHKRKAAYFRDITGDKRFKTQAEAKNETTLEILKTNFSRPFIMGLEPIVLALTFYLMVIYIVLFTFLDGYEYIFGRVYGLNPGLTNVIFVGLMVGVLLVLGTVPFVWHRTKQQLIRDNDPGDGSKIDRESRLLFAMIGARLFWMAWTCYPSISIWSPILASVVLGFGIVTIFTSAYMYVIEAYEQLSASALTLVALVRYLAAGGLTVVGVPMYENLGPHYTLTILACISAAAIPIPYALYRWGPQIRKRSKYAAKSG